MAKRKKAQPWDAVFDQVHVKRDPEYRYVTPADTELDAIEAQVGSPLPMSYRAFVKRFGIGELEGWVRLNDVVPKPKQKQEDILTVASRTLELREFCKNEKYPANYEWLASLIYFARSGGGDEYAWDPADIPRSSPHERQFYYLPRMNEKNPVAAGRSFGEFIEWVDADARATQEGDPEAVFTPGFSFLAYYLRKKKTPKLHDVKLWLASNNHTVRDLALSIRDRKHTEAFPIVADALQEAGCTNADLLDSCRTGDPDIDGAWVLQYSWAVRKSRRLAPRVVISSFAAGPKK